MEGGGEGSSEEQGKQKLPIRTMAYLLGKLMPYMVPLFLVYFGEYLINQGIASVLTFPDSFVSGKEYMYYQFWYVPLHSHYIHATFPLTLHSLHSHYTHTTFSLHSHYSHSRYIHATFMLHSHYIHTTLTLHSRTLSHST